jgi:hypothetical protein
METYEYPTNLQNLILELERRFSNFKKIDVFKAVSNAYKKVRPLFANPAHIDLEEIKNIAVSDLNS